MKKLIAVSALAAAFAAVADPIDAEDFEYENNPAAANLGALWGSSNADDASAVKAYEGSDVAVPEISGPAWDGRADTNARYLELSTEGGILSHYFNTANEPQAVPADTGLFVDTLVQFTPTEDGGEPELTEGDKLAIWLNVSTSEGSAVSVTNLMVKAKSWSWVDDTLTPGVGTFALAKSNGTALTVDAGKWYRLTVKAVKSALTADGDDGLAAMPCFQILLDGDVLKATTAPMSADLLDALEEQDGFITSDMLALARNNQLFPSMQETATAELTAVSFKGSGAIDDLVLTTDDPFAAGSADLVQIGTTKYETLADALEAAQDGDVLELLGNVTLESGLVLPANAALNLTLDLGGHTVSYPTGTSSTYVIDVKDGNSLTVTNGTITTTGRGAYVEGELILENGANLTSDCRTLNIVGIVNNWGIGTVEEDHPAICTIKAGATATHGNGDTVCAFVRGTGSGNRNDYHAKAILNVYGSLIDTGTTPGQYGITGNGGNASIGEINFYDGSVYTFADTTRPMMWLPQNDLNLYGGTLTSAGGGILFYCGHLNVPADSTVVVTANGPAGTFTGYSALDYSADALYLADQGTRYPWGENAGGALPDEIACRIDANIAGGTFVSANGSGIATYLEPSQSAAALVSECVTGGLFSDAIETVLFEEGFKAVPTDNDMYTVGPDALAGTGTEADPFVIDSRRHLKAFRNGVNDGTYGAAGTYYIQTADIDLEGQTWETPIGTGLRADGGICFSGHYDGQNHVIENFTLSSVSYAGLFAAMDEGYVGNLQILNATSPANAQAICVAFGDVEVPSGKEITFENITVSGTIVGDHNVGGLCSWTQGNINFISCTNNANCTTINAKVGGFTPIWKGVSNGMDLYLTNCCNNGAIVNTHSGRFNGAALTDSTCVAGGFICYTQVDGSSILIADCVNNGAVTCSASAYSQNNTTKEFTVSGTCVAGGFIGAQTSADTTRLVDCVNAGAIMADGSLLPPQHAQAGAFIGSMNANGTATLDNVTNDGAVTATPGEGGAAKVGAFVANNTVFNEETGKGLTLTLGQVLTSLDLAPFGNEVAVGGYTDTKTEGDYTVYYVGSGDFNVDWDTAAADIWGSTLTDDDKAAIRQWAEDNNLATEDIQGEKGAAAYLLGMTAVPAALPSLEITAIEQDGEGTWKITVKVVADGTDFDLSSALKGKLNIKTCAELGTDSWTPQDYAAPTLTDGKAVITVTAEGAKFMKAFLAK